jgi:hypothetical protein
MHTRVGTIGVCIRHDMVMHTRDGAVTIQMSQMVKCWRHRECPTMDGDCGGGVWTTAGDEADTEGGVAMAATPRVSQRRHTFDVKSPMDGCRTERAPLVGDEWRHREASLECDTKGATQMASRRMDGAPRAPPEWRRVTELSWLAPGRHSGGLNTGDWRGSPPSGKSDGGPACRCPEATIFVSKNQCLQCLPCPLSLPTICRGHTPCNSLE